MSSLIGNPSRPPTVFAHFTSGGGLKPGHTAEAGFFGTVAWRFLRACSSACPHQERGGCSLKQGMDGRATERLRVELFWVI